MSKFIFSIHNSDLRPSMSMMRVHGFFSIRWFTSCSPRDCKCGSGGAQSAVKPGPVVLDPALQCCLSWSADRLVDVIFDKKEILRPR